MRFWPLIPLLVFGLLVGFLWRGLSLEPQQLPSVQIGKPLPHFELPTLNHKTFSSTSLIGQVVLLNVWASWCEACKQEQVFLLRLSQTGIPLYGLNYKDNTQEAKQWLKEWGNPYQIVGADRTGKVAIDLGVYGAPETFLIDKKGKIRLRHVGILNESNWNTQFLPLIKQLETES